MLTNIQSTTNLYKNNYPKQINFRGNSKTDSYEDMLKDIEESFAQKKAKKEQAVLKRNAFIKNYKIAIIASLAAICSALGFFIRPLIVSGENEQIKTLNNKIENLKNDIDSKKAELNNLNTELTSKQDIFSELKAQKNQIDSLNKVISLQNKKNEDKKNPAVNQNAEELTEYLETDMKGWTRLHHYCKDGNADAVKIFLEKHPNVNLYQTSAGGWTYMRFACENGHKDIVNLIATVDNYDPTIGTSIGGWTDLHFMCKDGYTDAVKTVLERNPKIDLSTGTIGGSTYIDLARKNNHKELVVLLEKYM